MTQKELLLIVRLVAEEMDDVHKGKATSSFTTLANRLKSYSAEYDRSIVPLVYKNPEQR